MVPEPSPCNAFFGGCCAGARDRSGGKASAKGTASPPPPSPSCGGDGSVHTTGGGAAGPQPTAAGLLKPDEPQVARWWPSRLCCRRRRVPDGGAGHEEPAKEEEHLKAEAEAAALRALEEELGPTGLADVKSNLVPGETVESCLLRFLRARELRIPAAADMLRKDLAWRNSINMRALSAKRPCDIAGCDEDMIRDNLPCWHQGYDREGRPVVFKHYGKTRLRKLFPQVSVEGLELLHAYENERTAMLCGEQTVRLGREVTKAVYIIDADGWDPANMRSPIALTYAQKMAKVDQDHYPERLGQVVIINSPVIVTVFWGLVRNFLDSKTRDKVRIYSSRKQWIPVLHELIDPAQIPFEYGGKGSLRCH